MPADRVLTQEELDRQAQAYDFRRTDRIAKDQLRNIHLLHENFARALASSLSAYLRSYVVVNLVSVEQVSFKEFTQALPSPTTLIALGVKPYDGNLLLELDPSLVFPILEMLLGGSGKIPTRIEREITEIEQSILDGLMRIILQDLSNAWLAVTPLEFSIESHGTDPQLMQTLAANEAVIAVGMEVRIGETAGMMNLGIPSMTVKMLRQKFDQPGTIRRTQATEEDRSRLLRLVRKAMIRLDARLEGPSLRVDALLDLQEGDILDLDHPLARPVSLLVNGKIKYYGEVIQVGSKRAFQVQELVFPSRPPH